MSSGLSQMNQIRRRYVLYNVDPDPSTVAVMVSSGRKVW
jgi:hypothetical protein